MLKKIFYFFTQKHNPQPSEIKSNVVKKSVPVKTAADYFNDGKKPLDQNTEELYDEFYSDTEALKDYYSSSRLGFYKMVIAHLKNENVKLNAKNILDAGCGNGHLLNEIDLSFKDCTLSGSDFSQAGIDYAKTLFPKYSFFKHNLYKQISDKFDVIFCTEVLEHLEFPETALLNIIDSLNEDGIAIITVPDGRKDDIEEHINFWSPESWKCFISRESKGLQFKTYVLDKKHNLAIIYKSFK